MSQRYMDEYQFMYYYYYFYYYYFLYLASGTSFPGAFRNYELLFLLLLLLLFLRIFSQNNNIHLSGMICIIIVFS